MASTALSSAAVKISNKSVNIDNMNPKRKISSFRTTMTRPSVIITKTCPCVVYPLEPHFYIEKLGFEGVYLFFLFLIQNIHCGYSLEPPRRGSSNVYPQCMF